MNAQPTPDELTAENELICEKLLRWQPVRACRTRIKEWLDTPYGDDGAQWHTVVTPSFTAWAEAGLIMDALSEAGLKTVVGDKSVSGGWWCTADAICQLRNTGPLAIRATALKYIRSLPCDLCKPERKCPDHGACVTDGEV